MRLPLVRIGPLTTTDRQKQNRLESGVANQSFDNEKKVRGVSENIGSFRSRAFSEASRTSTRESRLSMNAVSAKRCGASFVVALAAILANSGWSNTPLPFHPDELLWLNAPLGLERLADGVRHPSVKLRKDAFEVIDLRRLSITSLPALAVER